MNTSSDRSARPSLWPAGRVAGAALIGAFAVQLLAVSAIHHGRWTGPFLVGEERQRQGGWPLEVAASPVGTGYDGQFYLQLALDPAVRGLARTADLPRYRARRILVPALAWVTGGGQAPAVVATYYLWCALFVALGAGALADAARGAGRSPWWGLLFLVQLGTVVCLWRMLLDSAAAGLSVAAVAALARDRERTGVALLAAALLARETAALLLVAVVAAYWLAGRRRSAAQALWALAPAALWWLWIYSTVPAAGPSTTAINLGSPVGVWLSEARGAVVPWVSRLVALKELSALAASLLAIAVGLGLAGWAVRRRRSLPVGPLSAGLALGLYSVLALALGETVWSEPWAYARVLLPLPVLAAFVGLAQCCTRRGWLTALLPALAGGAAASVFVIWLLRISMP